MVTVTGGMFTMGGKDGAIDGDPAGDANRDECPHQVTVSSFSIGQYEVN